MWLSSYKTEKKDKVPSYLVISEVVQNFATSKSHILKAVVDSNSLFYLIFLIKKKKYNF